MTHMKVSTAIPGLDITDLECDSFMREIVRDLWSAYVMVSRLSTYVENIIIIFPAVWILITYHLQ